MMRTRSRISLLIVVGFAISVPLGASATLIGDEVLIEQNRTLTGTLRDDLVTVGSGAELSCPGAFELCSANIPGFSGGSIDIGESSILFDLGDILWAAFEVDTFNGYIFSDLDWVGGPGEIIGADLSTDIDGLDASRVSFGVDFVAINFSGLTLDADDTFFEVALHVGPIPEPSAAILFGVGALICGWAVRRRA